MARQQHFPSSRASSAITLLFVFLNERVASFFITSSTVHRPSSPWLFTTTASSTSSTRSTSTSTSTETARKTSDAHFHRQIQLMSSSNGNDEEFQTADDNNAVTAPQQKYRSIGEVVGGLHGGKYLFDNGIGYGGGDGDGFYTTQSAFDGVGSSSCSSNGELGEEEDEEMPNWAKKMQPPSEMSSTTGSDAYETIRIPSNSNPMDGMTYSAKIRIKNDERTWEKFYTKIMCIENGRLCSEEEMGVEGKAKPFYVLPRSGHLAPRGGASNACDASNPYSDSVVLQIIHSANEIVSEGQEWWLVSGTEEEKWYFKLAMEEG